MSTNLPFTFDYPSGCIVQQLGSTLVITRRNPKFRLNLMRGAHLGSHSVPPGYKLVEQKQLLTPKGNINLLVAFSSAYSLPNLIMNFVVAIILGAIVGTLLFSLFGGAIPIADRNLWILAASLLIWAYFVLTTKSKVKYAFIYDGFEYVFTGLWAQKTEVDACIASISFI